jgi:hypothetical protein
MSTLRDITAEYQALAQLLDEAEEAGQDLTSPEVVDTVARWYAAMDGNLTQKATACLAVIRDLTAGADAVADEIARLRALEASRRGRAARIRDAVQCAMTIAEVKRIDTPLGVFTRQGNGGLQPLHVDPTTDPAEVLATRPDLVVVTTTINNDAVRKAIAAGDDIPFAQLLPRGEHLRIR